MAIKVKFIPAKSSVYQLHYLYFECSVTTNAEHLHHYKSISFDSSEPASLLPNPWPVGHHSCYLAAYNSAGHWSWQDGSAGLETGLRPDAIYRCPSLGDIKLPRSHSWLTHSFSVVAHDLIHPDHFRRACTEIKIRPSSSSCTLSFSYISRVSCGPTSCSKGQSTPSMLSESLGMQKKMVGKEPEWL